MAKRKKIKNPYIVFNKLILFTVTEYLEKAKAEGLTGEPFHNEIIGAISKYKTFAKFSVKEARIIIKMGESEAMHRIKEQQISWVVYALELLKLWVEAVPKKYRPHLNISDERLRTGRSKFVMAMIRLKSADPKEHAHKQNIMNDSTVTAKKYLMYTHEQLVGEFLQM